MHYSTHHHHRRVVQYSSSAAKTRQGGGEGRRPRCVDLTLTRVAPKIKQHEAWIVKRRGGMGWGGRDSKRNSCGIKILCGRCASRCANDRSIKLIVPVCFGGCSPERRWKIGDVDDARRCDYMILKCIFSFVKM